MTTPPYKLTEYNLQKELDHVLQRLEYSWGRRIARRNARRMFYGLIQRINNHVETTYPRIDKDGNNVQIAGGRIVCPDCKASCLSGFSLVQHIMAYHAEMIRVVFDTARDGYHGLTCVCDKTFKGKKGLAAHLSYQHRTGQLESHWIKGSTTLFLEGIL